MPRRNSDNDTTIDATASTDDASASATTGPVANPPAGGDQTQASTNDSNQNTILQTAPAVVVASADRRAGVVSRFPERGAAENDAAARRDGAPEGTKYTVMDESELPEFVSRVEAGEQV